MHLPFSDARSLTAYAKEMLPQFNGSFQPSDSTKISITKDQAGLFVHTLRIVEPNSSRLKVMAWVMTGLLHSALDHTITECVRLTGAEPTNTTGFPFARKLDDLSAQFGRKCKNVPVDVLEYMRTLEPYAGGFSQLYELSDLRNQNLHVKLSDFAVSLAAIEVLETPFTRIAMIDIPPGTVEMELVRTAVEPNKTAYQLVLGHAFDDRSKLSTFGFDGHIVRVNQIIDKVESIMRGLSFIAA